MLNQIEIIQKYCKLCGVCAYVCPKNVFDFRSGSYPVAARSQDCVGCRQCEYKCPDFAIVVKKEEEHA